MSNSVTWVGGRRTAFARAMAIFAAAQGPVEWLRMPQAERNRLMLAAQQAVKEWEAGGVLVTFQAEYREAPGGGVPVAKRKPASTKRH